MSSRSGEPASRSFAKGMQCPRCVSHNTQSAKMGYSQSVRTGYNGTQTISEYGKTLEPPEPLCELGTFFATGVFVTMVSLFLIPNLPVVVDFAWAQGLSVFDWPVIVVSVVIGIVAGLRSAVSASTYNTSIFQPEMQGWERGVVCRRCGHRFSR